jgi:hypothetical protein
VTARTPGEPASVERRRPKSEKAAVAALGEFWSLGLTLVNVGDAPTLGPQALDLLSSLY